jgi:catechol 2,3-dioxygenase-like lactoylglutathione lyase family enzyme
VLDQDETLDFYTNKLGFQVRTDERMADFRWLTVTPPRQPDHELIRLSPARRRWTRKRPCN